MRPVLNIREHTLDFSIGLYSRDLQALAQFNSTEAEFVAFVAALLTILAMTYKSAVYLKQKRKIIIRKIQELVLQKVTRQKLRPFWGEFISQNCTLVLPIKDHTQIEDNPEWIRTMYLDYFSMATLQLELEAAFGSIDISWTQSDTVSQQQLNHNLISVAGPQPNRVTATLLEQPEIVYRFPENSDNTTVGDYIGQIVSVGLNHERTYQPETQDGDVVRDVGVITKMRNPYNTEKDAVFACGIWGWGTLAGFKLLTDETTINYLSDEGGEYFQVIYTVEIDEEGQMTEPHLLDLHPDETIQEDTIVSLEYQ